MDRLIYTAVSGLSSSKTRLQVIANNMANAQTTGFRAETFDDRPVTLKGPGLEARAMADTAVRGASLEAGATIATGRTLDIAINGTAMLAVQAADGEEAYTRRGDLSIVATGLLVNGDGRPVVGASGPVSIPPGMQVAIAPDGSISLIDPALPEQPPQPLDRIKLANPDGSPIAKALDGLFRVTGGGVLPQDEEARLTSGALEQSNVKPTEVLVEMIEAQRMFDMRSKLIATARELDEGSAGLMRITG